VIGDFRVDKCRITVSDSEDTSIQGICMRWYTLLCGSGVRPRGCGGATMPRNGCRPQGYHERLDWSEELVGGKRSWVG
jgi:hypothetical protein